MPVRPSRLIAAFATMTLSAPAVPGAAAASASATADSAPPTKPYVVVLEGSADATAAATTRLQRDLGFDASRRFARALRGFSADLSSAQVDRLRRHATVAHVVPDIAIAAAASSRKPPRTQPESVPVGVRRIGAEASEPANAAVAVLDTGLDLENPDLNAAHGTNCIKAGKRADDDNGHGTHVAGTIGARADGRDVVGVAPGTRLYAVKVLDGNNKGRLSNLLCGVEWVKANAERLDIRVANVSIAAAGSDDGACGARNSDPLHAAICSSAHAGIVYVAAAGNAAADFSQTVPAAYSETLAVTAATDTDGLSGGRGPEACEPGERDDHAATYSNFGSSSAAADHVLAAPGTCVVSSGVGGGVATMMGTSMATPHVAATAALCLGSGGSPGPCRSSDPTQLSRVVIERLRADAAAAADDGFGFAGDPFQPFSGRVMGHLVSAAGY